MSDTFGLEGQREFIERNIIQSFGSSLIEFEAVLYQKYLLLSGSASLTTEKAFRRILSNMHASGNITPLEFQGKRCWKRLLIEDDDVTEDLTKEQVQQILTGIKSKQKDVLPSQNTRRDSEQVANEILSMIREKIFHGNPLDGQTKSVLKDIITGLRRALADSVKDFLKYVDEYIPTLRKEMQQLVEKQGENIILLSLRKIESEQRAT